MGISQPKAAADPRTTQPSHQHAPSTASSAPSRPPAGVEPTDGGHHRKVSNARMFDNHLHGGLPGRVASIPAHLQHEAHNNGSSCPRSSSGGFTRGAVVEQGMIPTSQRLDGSHSSRYPPSTSSLRVGPANTTISMGSTNKTPMLNSPLTLTSSPTGRGGADGPGAAASSFPISKEGISCSTMMAMMIQQQQQQQHHQLPIVHDPSRSIDSNHRRELSDQEHLGSSLFSLESDDANSEAEEKTLFGPDANRHGQRLPATAGGEAHLLHDGSGSDCSDTVNMRTLLNTSFDARNMMRHSRGLAAKRLDSKVQRTSNNNNNNSNGTTNNFRMVVPLTTQRSCGSAVDESSESAVSATWMGSVQFVDEVAKHVNDNIAPRTSTGFRDASGGPMPASSRPRGANSRSTRGVLSIQWMPYELREEEAITPVGTCAHRAQNSGGCSNGRGSGGAANNEVWEASSPHAMAPHFSNLHDGSARASPSSPPLGCDLSSSSPIGILVKRSGGDGGRSNGSWSSGSENCLTSPSSRTNSGAGSRTSKCSTAQVVSVIVPTSTPAAQYISSRRSSTSGSRQHNSAGRGSMASHPATSSGCACISCSTAAAQKPEANIVASTAVWQQASSSSSPHPSPASPLETPVSGDSQTTNNKKMKDGGQSYRSPGVKKEMEVPCRRIRSPIIDGATRHSLQLAKHATADYELFIRALKEKQAVLAKTS